MFIEQPPELLRRLYPDCEFRIEGEGKKVYLTFDDGPIPESTPFLLDLLDSYGIKATFFVVGDNVRKYPALFRDILERGHRAGNHTMHHLQGMKVSTERYLADIEEARRLVDSPLFRPPHGLLRRSQMRRLSKRYRLIIHDLLTRDYNPRVSEEKVVAKVRRYARPGAIIVFHDSLKSIGKNRRALPESIEWLMKEGYEFALL